MDDMDCLDDHRVYEHRIRCDSPMSMDSMPAYREGVEHNCGRSVLGSKDQRLSWHIQRR
jgi:hypothetical protein